MLNGPTTNRTADVFVRTAVRYRCAPVTPWLREPAGSVAACTWSPMRLARL